jgi:hypothetical protein
MEPARNRRWRRRAVTIESGDLVSDKQPARALIDQLDPSQLAAAVHLLEAIVKFERDGDTLSPAERHAVAEADEWLKHNQPIPHDEVPAEFGLTMSDWERMAGKLFDRAGQSRPSRH